MKQTLFIDDEVIANLNPPFNNFNSKQIIQILERIVDTNYSKLKFEEIELIRTLEKFHPNIIEEINAKLTYEEELEEIAFYNESFDLENASPFAGWSDEEEQELMGMHSYESYSHNYLDEELYDDNSDSIFFNEISTCVGLNMFILDLDKEEVLDGHFYSFETFPDISEMLIQKFGANDYLDKNHLVTESGSFIGMNADCVNALTIDIDKILGKFDAFDDAEFINSYAELFNINHEEFPYFTEHDILDLGESLTMLLDALFFFNDECTKNINKNLLLAITVD